MKSIILHLCFGLRILDQQIYSRVYCENPESGPHFLPRHVNFLRQSGRGSPVVWCPGQSRVQWCENAWSRVGESSQQKVDAKNRYLFTGGCTQATDMAARALQVCVMALCVLTVRGQKKNVLFLVSDDMRPQLGVFRSVIPCHTFGYAVQSTANICALVAWSLSPPHPHLPTLNPAVDEQFVGI